jgi:hypothetical protein
MNLRGGGATIGIDTAKVTGLLTDRQMVSIFSFGGAL